MKHTNSREKGKCRLKPIRMSTTPKLPVSHPGISTRFRMSGSIFCRGRAPKKKLNREETQALKKRPVLLSKIFPNKSLITLNWLLGKWLQFRNLTEQAKVTVQILLAFRSKRMFTRSCSSNKGASLTPSMKNSHYQVCTNHLKDNSSLKSALDASKQRLLTYRPSSQVQVLQALLQHFITRTFLPQMLVSQTWSMSRSIYAALKERSLKWWSQIANLVCTKDWQWDFHQGSNAKQHSVRLKEIMSWVHQVASKVQRSIQWKGIDRQQAALFRHLWVQVTYHSCGTN